MSHAAKKDALLNDAGATITLIHVLFNNANMIENKAHLPMKSATQSSKFNDVDFLAEWDRTSVNAEAGAGNQTANTKIEIPRRDNIFLEPA